MDTRILFCNLGVARGVVSVLVRGEDAHELSLLGLFFVFERGQDLGWLGWIDREHRLIGLVDHHVASIVIREHGHDAHTQTRLAVVLLGLLGRGSLFCISMVGALTSALVHRRERSESRERLEVAMRTALHTTHTQRPRRGQHAAAQQTQRGAHDASANSMELVVGFLLHCGSTSIERSPTADQNRYSTGSVVIFACFHVKCIRGTMESYGAELKETPYPLIAALGARELQAKVLQFVRTINEEFVPKLHFTSLPVEHRFPVKKEVREKHGTFPNQTQRDFEGYRVQGILKTKWLKKHHELVPAVVLLFHEYDPRWTQRDWLTQETTIKEQMDQLKRGLSGRECRVLLVLIQQVDDAGVAPVNVTDERLASLRRRLETDSKTIVLLRSRDLVRGSSVLAKLESSIRNYALEYYKAQAKRVKRYKKALNKSSLVPLHVRYSFKIAHYYEFRRYTTKVLQHYEAAYRAVVQLPLTHDAAAAVSDKTETEIGIGFTQVKTIAEFINFKLCYHLIFSSNNIKAAVEQLHRHMKVYGRAMAPVERAFEHWEWVSRQYHVFAQLLAEAVSIRGSLPSAGLDADVYKEPYLYYSIAAKYASYRRKAAARLGLADPEAVVKPPGSTDGPLNADFKIIPSAFVGGDPIISEAAMPDPSYGAFVKYRYSIEKTIPHARRTIHLLEQALHHLALYVADQKVPRNRLKSRFLVELGIERLACNDFDRSRGELQKAKLAFGTEQWWPETAQILKNLLTCTFHQADTAAYIDNSLQLLSPILEEFVPVMDRMRVQESFEAAWKDPAQLGAPFTSESALSSYEIVLDATRAMFSVQAHFDRVYACVREEVTLCMQLDSFFPSNITMSKIELLFSDERYNMEVLHRSTGSSKIVRDETDGKWYASLEFDPMVSKEFRINFRVLDGRNILRYQETRFLLGSGQGRASAVDGTVGEEQFLTFVLPYDSTAVAVAARRAMKPVLLDGRVPVMGMGPGSPSFVRRKSMFSVAELGRSHELDTGDLVEEDGRTAVTRSSALAILQPRPKATLDLVTKHDLLAGDYRVITFLLRSKEDTLQNPTFRVTTEPPPASASPNDAIFYCEDPEARGFLTPVPLDDNHQPRDRTRVRDMEPHSDEKFSVIVRSSRATTLRLAVHVTYSTKAGVQVSLEERYELQCRTPLTLSSGFVHDFPHGAGAAQAGASKQTYAIVGKAVNLNGSLQCEALEPLRIVSMAFEPSFECGSSLSSGDMVTSGFGTWGEDSTDECQVLRQGDSRSFCLRLLPSSAAPFVSLGQVKVQWRRLSSIVPTSDEQRNDLVTTWLDIPSVSFVDAPLTISLHTPSFGIEGSLLTLQIRVRNNENVFHSVRIKPFDDSGDFMISGRTNAVEDLLPLDEHVFRIGLVPTKCGYLRLPQLELTSVTYNLPFANSNERHELFVFPRESSAWKGDDAAHQPIASAAPAP